MLSNACWIHVRFQLQCSISNQFKRLKGFRTINPGSTQSRYSFMSNQEAELVTKILRLSKNVDAIVLNRDLQLSGIPAEL